MSESEQTKNYSPYHLCYNCVAPLLVCIQLSAHEFSQPGIIVIFSCTMQYYFFLSALVIWRSDRLRRFYRFVICRVLFCQQQRQRSCYLILQPLMAQRDEHFMYMFVYTYLTAPAISLGRWINAILTLMNEGRRRANSPGVIIEHLQPQQTGCCLCALLMYVSELSGACKEEHVFICCAAGWVQLDVILQLDILVHVMLLTLYAPAAFSIFCAR